MPSPTKSQPEPQVQVVPIADLVADPANVRRRDERANATLEASLRRFGPARSLVVDNKGVVRAGSGTLEAAARAGVSEVLIVDPQPGQLVAVRRGDWSPSEATAYAIADNRTAELATWDYQALGDQLRSLQSEDFELAAIGYEPADIDAMIEQLGTDRLQGDVVDDPQGEWQGMPEFEHEDLTPHRTIHVHFKSDEDVQDFAKLIGQPITDVTKFLWFPKQEIRRYGIAE